jgi:uncharacterized protein (TIGR00297 family)
MALILGALASIAIAALAYYRRVLNAGGALAAVLVGTLVFGCGGWRWGVLLVVFFVTSSALSRFRQGEKKTSLDRGAKSGRRDAAQVLANGGVVAILALLAVLSPADAWFPVAIGGLAAVTADTWATELGGLSRRPPRLFVSGQPVPKGTSGAVTTLGSATAVLGATVIGLAAGVISDTLAWWQATVVGAVAGTAGAFVDSLLGATAQAVYRCEACGEDTEVPVHRCGRPARRIRGWAVLGNDEVNAAASLAGAAFGWLAWRLVGG